MLQAMKVQWKTTNKYKNKNVFIYLLLIDQLEKAFLSLERKWQHFFVASAQINVESSFTCTPATHQQ